MASPAGAWDAWSLRTRLLVLTLAGVAVVQAIGSTALYVGLAYSGNRAIDASARATAAEVVSLAEAGRLPATLPVTGSEVVQVLDAQGRVVSASTNADRLTAILTAAERTRAVDEPVTVAGSRLGVASRLRTRVTPVSDASGTRLGVLVAEPVDDLTRGEQRLPTLLVASWLVLLVVLGLLSWRVVGAALRPVEQLRTAAERISGSPRRGERLPLPAADDELRSLATTLNSLLDRVAAARARERDLVADVAHELRSPLASMRLQVDVATRTGITADALVDLDLEVQRMSALVDDLLVLARLDHDRPEDGAAARAALGPVLAGTTRGRDGVELRLPSEVGALDVAATPEELERVVGNLVTNALRHTRSTVVVSARVVPGVGSTGRVVVAVDDDGPGIAAADRERVFERFVRLDDARDRDSGGSGLGLAIARELARGRQGDVRLGVAPAGGLRAEVDLPLAPALEDRAGH